MSKPKPIAPLVPQNIVMRRKPDTADLVVCPPAAGSFMQQCVIINEAHEFSLLVQLKEQIVVVLPLRSVTLTWDGECWFV